VNVNSVLQKLPECALEPDQREFREDYYTVDLIMTQEVMQPTEVRQASSMRRTCVCHCAMNPVRLCTCDMIACRTYFDMNTRFCHAIKSIEASKSTVWKEYPVC
jgi:hypothetical protein